MRLLDRYIGSSVVNHTAIVMGVLLTLYFFSAFVAEMGYVGRGDYGMAEAVAYSLMLIPRQVYELFPLVALLGSMLGLGALAGTSELTVIRAAGVSVRRVVLSVMKVGLVMMFLVALVGEGIAPPLEKQARIARAQALSEQIQVNAENGLWAREGQTFVHIDRLLPDGQASGISLYQLGEEMVLQSVVHAHTAQHTDTGWELYDVTRQTLGALPLREERMERLFWSSSMTPEVVNIVAVPPENLSILDLTDYIGYLHENNLEARHYELSLWVRVVAPLATGGMMLLAIPFVVGSLRSVSLGKRVMTGALLGIGFYLFNGIFNRIGLVYELPPLLSALIPTLFVYGLWFWLMRRVA